MHLLCCLLGMTRLSFMKGEIAYYLIAAPISQPDKLNESAYPQ